MTNVVEELIGKVRATSPTKMAYIINSGGSDLVTAMAIYNFLECLPGVEGEMKTQSLAASEAG